MKIYRSTVIRKTLSKNIPRHYGDWEIFCSSRQRGKKQVCFKIANNANSDINFGSLG